MNINSILEKADLFTKLIKDSGFSRNLNDYINFINQNKSIVSFMDITKKVLDKFEEFENNSLEEELSLILKKSPSFLDDKKLIEELNDLYTDTQIDVNTYFSKLQNILNRLKTSLDKNIGEVDVLISNFTPYQTQALSYEQKDENAVLALVFNDLNSISTIKGFYKVLKKWNKTLYLYHQLLKSDTPQEIELECVQEGCIEVVFNFNFDLALSLTDVINHGMDLLFSYIIYKEGKTKLSKHMTKIKKIKDLEEQEEKVFLENLNEELYEYLLEEHNKALEKDPNINKESVEQKVKDVSSVIFEHLIKGNKLKLLTKIELETANEETEEENQVDKQEELRENTAKLHEKLKNNREEVEILLEYLELPKEDIEKE